MYPINLDNVPDGFKLIDDKASFDPKNIFNWKNQTKFIH
jgi:hypothetical protein